MANAINMLKSDHTAIKRLLRELSNLEGSAAQTIRRREGLIRQIEREVKMHSQIEEEIFYPAFKAAAEKKKRDTDLFYEAAEEHHVVDMVLPSLKTANPKSPEFQAKTKVLKELIEHHIREEEREMFAQAAEMFTPSQLNELGELMQARKEQAAAMWDNPLLRPVKKLQSVAHKMMPTKAKTAKAEAIAKGMERRAR